MRWSYVLPLGLVWLFMPGAATAQSPRNVVLIIADDLGRDLGCYGNAAVRTPNLDKLAKRGVRFTRAYATVASCSPSRASILTGLYTHQNGQYGLQHPPHSQQTHGWVQSLPNLLRAAGYYTGLIGKFHVGPNSVYNFHEVITKGTGGNRDVVAMARLAREFITRGGKRPFFLVYGLGDTHRAKEGFGNEAFAKDPAEVRFDPKDVVVPYHLPDTQEVRKELTEYYQSIARLDRGVGLLLEALREEGQLENTLIIFISDNGIPFPGAKTTLYSAGIHLPLLIAGPDVPQERTNNALVSYVDLAPTVLDFAKAKSPAHKLPGRSLLPILDQDNPKGFDVVFGSHQFHEITMDYPMRTIVTSKCKLIVNLSHERTFPFASDLWESATWQGIRRRGDKEMGQRSVPAFLHRPKEELYDLSKDPNELKNLVADPALTDVLGDLRRRLRAWQQETNDPWAILYREDGGDKVREKDKNKPAGDPRMAKLFTSDIDNFWRAFDLVRQEGEADKHTAIIQQEYLDKGSIGLKDFIRLRIKDAKSLAQTVHSQRDYYASARASTLKIAGFDKRIRATFFAMKHLYEDAIFPDVYFVIGKLSTGGTTSGRALLIGAEMYGRTDKAPLGRLSLWHKEVLKPIDTVPAIVAHELIHFQQKHPFSFKTALLRQSIIEGAADFLGEMISGLNINQHLHDYGNPRQRELWAEFKKDLKDNKTDRWLYNGNQAKGRPADLGYYIGYKIVEAYYQRVTDKTQAIKDILLIKDFEKFLKDSGYEDGMAEKSLENKVGRLRASYALVLSLVSKRS